MNILTKASTIIEEIKELLNILELEYSIQKELTKEQVQLETILKSSYTLQIDTIENKDRNNLDWTIVEHKCSQNAITKQKSDVRHSLHLCQYSKQGVIIEQVQRTPLYITKQVAKVDTRGGSQLFIEVSIND